MPFRWCSGKARGVFGRWCIELDVYNHGLTNATGLGLGRPAIAFGARRGSAFFNGNIPFRGSYRMLCVPGMACPISGWITVDMFVSFSPYSTMDSK